MPNPTCPNCGSSDYVVPILYYQKSGSKDGIMFKIVDQPTNEEAYQWHCVICNSMWHTIHADPKKWREILSIYFDIGPLIIQKSWQYRIDFSTKTIAWGTVDGVPTREDIENSTIMEYKKPISEKDLIDLRQGIEKTGLLQWQNEYVGLSVGKHQEIRDKYSWRIVIHMKGIEICKEGNNSYPKSWIDWCQLMKTYAGEDLGVHDIQQILWDFKDPTKKMMTITMTNTTPRKFKPLPNKPWKQIEQAEVVKPDREIIRRIIAREEFPKCPICGRKNVKQKIYLPYPEKVDRKFYFYSGKVKDNTSYDWWCSFCGYRWYYGCNDSLQFKDIQKIHFEAGSCFDLFLVHYLIDFTEHAICWDDDDFFSFDPEHVYPYGKRFNRSEWNQLYQTLEKMNLLLWMGTYDRKFVLDGYHWALDIMTKDTIISKRGSNDQPKPFFTLAKILEEHTFQEIQYPGIRDEE
jgi:hypothetical protein